SQRRPKPRHPHHNSDPRHNSPARPPPVPPHRARTTPAPRPIRRPLPQRRHPRPQIRNGISHPSPPSAPATTPPSTNTKPTSTTAAPSPATPSSPANTTPPPSDTNPPKPYSKPH